jgi:hypothetical protein
MLIKNGHPEIAKFNNLLGLGPGDTMENDVKSKKEDNLNSVSSASSLLNNPAGNPDEKKEIKLATSSSKASVSHHNSLPDTVEEQMQKYEA